MGMDEKNYSSLAYANPNPNSKSCRYITVWEKLPDTAELEY